mgnify:CR=1 FL=1
MEKFKQLTTISTKKKKQMKLYEVYLYSPLYTLFKILKLSQFD